MRLGALQGGERVLSPTDEDVVVSWVALVTLTLQVGFVTVRGALEGPGGPVAGQQGAARGRPRRYLQMPPQAASTWVGVWRLALDAAPASPGHGRSHP